MPGLERVVGRLPDAVIVLDDGGSVVAWLGAAEEIFGWSEAEMIGAKIDDRLKSRDSNGNPCCFGPCDTPSVLSITKRLLEYEVLATTKSGDDIWVGITCGFERDGDRISRSIVAARDITRRKTVDLEKSEVISAVSHELRSPLTSVKGFTKTLLDRWDRFNDEQKRHYLETINADADRLKRLIDELLDIARIEAGRVQLRRRLVDVEEIATRVIARIGSLSDRHTLKLDVPADLPRVFADPDKLEQILTNLLENAVKYTDAGLVRVAADRQTALVRISVADQGGGIPQEHRTQVFGKFYRRGDRVGNPSGTGLGLYISKGLVEAHGGTMWVDAAPGGGALFAFTLPISGPES